MCGHSHESLPRLQGTATVQQRYDNAAHHVQVSVEAGSTFGWERYIGSAGKAIGVDRYGASAPAPILYEKFGITKAAAVEAAKSML